MYRILKVFTLLILFFSCKHIETYEGSSDDEVVVAFDKVKQSSIKRDISYLPRWQERIEFEGSLFIPMSTDKKLSSYTTNNTKYSLNRRIWLKAIKYADKWTFTLVTVLPNDNRDSKNSGVFLYEDYETGGKSYEGYIGQRLLKGEVYEREIRKISGKLDKRAQLSPVGVICRTISSEICAGSGRDEYCTYRTEVVCTSTTIPGGGSGGNTNPPPVGSGGHGGGSGVSNNTPPIVVDDVDYEQLAIDVFNESIDDTNLPDCMKGVLDTLKMLNGNSVADMIKKFAGYVPGYKLKFITQNLSDPMKFAVTTPDNNGDMIIGLNTNPLVIGNVSDLAIGATMLHESIHAYLYAFYDNDPVAATMTYPELFEKYSKEKAFSNGVQHEKIAKDFITDLAASIKNYGELKGYHLDKQIYDDIAWKGLLDTDAFKSLSDIDKSRITDRIMSEQYDTRRDKGVTQKGVRLGC